MRKLSLLASACISLIIVSCNNGASDTNSKMAKADSARADSERHSKLVVALAKDTNRHNFTDTQGKKQGQWTVTNATMHLPGYDTNAKVAQGEYKDDMKEGEWIEYNIDGSVKSKTIYKDDKPIQ